MESSAGRSAWGLSAVCVVALFAGASTAFSQIIITEIMQNPDATTDANGEWFELHNPGTQPVVIHEWTFEEADGGQSHEINSSGLSIAAGGYLVLAENGTSSTNGGVTAGYDYPSSFVLGNGSDEIVLKNASGTEVDRVEYDNGSTFPDPNGASMALKRDSNGNYLDNSVGANWCESQNAWTGSAGDKGTPGAVNDCPAGATTFSGEIYEIQGNGAASPELGNLATTEDNVVTAVGAGGFFIQTPTASSDNDADTSDGIFVLHDGTVTVNVGDQVDVTGEVEEFFGFTRLKATTSVTDASVTVDASNQSLPAPVEFDATTPSPDPANPSCAMEFECYEGMLIRIATGTVSGPSQSFGSDPVAEMYITPTSQRAFREKGVEYPGLTSHPGIPVWDGNPELFELDPDKLGLDNVSWVPGTRFSATGVLGYEFSGYEIWPKELAASSVAPPLPRPARARRAGEVSVASINMLNFDAAASSYGTKRNKLSLHVRQVLRSPDIVGVQEVFTIEALRGLAAEIRRDDPSVNYAAYLEVGNRDPGINVGFLVRSGVTVRSVTQHGKSETYLNPATNTNDLLHDRPPLLLEAAVEGIELSVLVIHNRSLISIDTERVRAKRLAQAQSVASLAQSLQDRKLIIVGDYNAFQFTDGYVDVVGQISGDVTASENLLSGPDLVDPNLINLIGRVPAAQRYSYAFRNSAQVLDHALVNQEMAGSVLDIQYARGNVDARTTESNDVDSPLRASDHDGFVVYLSAPGRLGPGDTGHTDDADDPGGPETPAVSEADLSLRAESRIVSKRLVHYNISVRNAGPDDARNVRVASTLEARGDFEVSTGGCEEDPNGLPTCSLGSVEAGETVYFTIEVALDGGSEKLVTYSGTVASDAVDSNPDNDGSGATTPLGAPPAPTELAARALSETEIELRWRDNSRTGTEFAVFQQGPGDSKLRLIGTAPRNSTSTIVAELVPNVTYRFAVEARNGPLASERTPKVAATTWTAETARCAEDDFLCLGRFQVEVAWEDGEGRRGRGMAERLTARSGDFWFFEPANIELVVKVLDGCSINGHWWVFAAGLTDVAVTMTVRDLRAGSPLAGVPTSNVERSWTSSVGDRFGPIADVAAFATCTAGADAAGRGNVISGAPRMERPASAGAAATTGCARDEASLCLQDGRYEVRANWRAGDESGAAGGIPRTPDTGMFWFFSPDNVELVVKVLDGCSINGHRWVVMGGLTDVGVEITVRDTGASDAAVKTYLNSEGGPFATRFDVTAFPCVVGR